MEPESYNDNPNATLSNTGKKVLILILVAVVVIGSIAFVLMQSPTHQDTKSNTNTGTMHLLLNSLPDTNGLSVSLNQEPITKEGSFPASGSLSEQLKKGDYTLQISKTGYKPFSATFTITPSQTTIINAVLQPIPVPSIIAWSQVHDDTGQPAADPAATDNSSSQAIPVTIKILSVKYFYDQAWAFITVNDGYINSYAVAQYDFTTNTWVDVAGGDPYFPNDSVNAMPGQVQAYLIDNNHTYLGG